MSGDEQFVPRGRGSPIQPPNRFESAHYQRDLEQLESDDEYLEQLADPRTQYLSDQSRSIISENDSPDLPFRYSLNPYRGCAHGCAYCYARPTHEYLGFSAGLDFETKVLVKHRAAQLFRDWLSRDGWDPEPICFSGVTDCYQPAERRFELTRQCLTVAQEAGQPIMIVTKNALVARDVDILAEMAAHRLVRVAISITSLNIDLVRTMEPRTSLPAVRLRTIARLRAAEVPTSVLVAPVIPGLTDSEIPAVLEASAHAGAMSASFTLLRLPLTVQPVFLEWLDRTQPTQREKVIHRIRATRDGKLSDSRFGARMRGSGLFAEQLAATFRLFARKYGLHQKMPALDVSRFRRPRPSSGQLRLF
jgi:DNA repair photolyase